MLEIRDHTSSVSQTVCRAEGVANLFTIKPRAAASEIETSIDATFERNAPLDAEAVRVETHDTFSAQDGSLRLANSCQTPPRIP